MANDSYELYPLLGVDSTASQEDIIDAYKKEVAGYENVASKLSRKDPLFKEADAKFREVSKAFIVLSDTSSRQQYDAGLPASNSSKYPNKIDKQRTGYQVKFNAQSVTIHLPKNLTKPWLVTCEKHYDVLATNSGKHGHQIKTSFLDTKSHQPLGSVSITFYESSHKILIQGSAYLLWFTEVYPSLMKSVNHSPNNAAHPTTAVLGPVSENPPPCPTCNQLVESDTCACNTVPKEVLDVNSNNVDDSESQPESQSDSPKESNKANTSVTSNCCIVQENVTKLESCLTDCIIDRKLFEDAVLEKLSAIESRVKACERSHTCDDLSPSEKEKLLSDIARLENNLRELELKFKSLEVKHESLVTTVCKPGSTCVKRSTSSRSTETQTANDSDRADNLLREVATISVQNRFQALDPNCDTTDAMFETPQGSVKRTNNNEVLHSHRDNTSAQRNEKKGTDTRATKTKQPFGVTSDTSRDTIQTDLRNKEATLDLLILGDSNTRTIQTNILYPNKNVRKELTFNLTQATTFIESTRIPDPKVILVHVGTNDARDLKDSSAVSEGFRKLIKSSHDKFPRTPLVLSSILPRDNHDLQTIGDNVNSFLHVVAEETNHVHLTDNSNLSENGAIKKSLYNYDGYHLNRYGTRVLASNIKKTVNPLLGLGQYSGRGSRSENTGRTSANASRNVPQPVDKQSAHGNDRLNDNQDGRLSYREAVLRSPESVRSPGCQRTIPHGSNQPRPQVLPQERPAYATKPTPDHCPTPVQPPAPVHRPVPVHHPATDHRSAPVHHPVPVNDPVPVHHSATDHRSAPVHHPAPVNHPAPVHHPTPVNYPAPDHRPARSGPPPPMLPDGPWGHPPVGPWGVPPYFTNHHLGLWGMSAPFNPTPRHLPRNDGRFPGNPHRSNQNCYPDASYQFALPPWSWQPGIPWIGPPPIIVR